jgi:hypothetical protein
MSEELENQQPADFVEEDVNTTPPNPSSGWKMPEPVFRKTSGYLPQGFEKKFPQEPASMGTADDPSPVSTPPPEDPIPVEPQPDIAEQVDFVSDEEIATSTTEPKKGSFGRIILIIFGLLVALGLILIFFAVVYYLFFMPEPTSAF